MFFNFANAINFHFEHSVFLSSIIWDPSRSVLPWNIPFLNRPIYWYGVFFALGFFIAYRLFYTILKKYSPQKLEPSRLQHFVDTFTFRIALCTVLGARLFDVLFYQSWSAFKEHPLKIFSAWEGGLASHGGVLGILLGIFFLYRGMAKPMRWILLDTLPIVGCFAGCFIRFGNFFNQEILGTETALPWGIIFANPLDGSAQVPRHPVQLYEAFFYLILGIVLYFLMRKKRFQLGEGKLFSLGLFAIFTFRFFIEFFKEEQCEWFPALPIHMGQLLSLPFILLALILLRRISFHKVLKQSSLE